MQRRRVPVRESINLRDSQRGASKSIRTTAGNQAAARRAHEQAREAARARAAADDAVADGDDANVDADEEDVFDEQRDDDRVVLCS